MASRVARSPFAGGAAVVVDLIGDLDIVLGSLLDEMLGRIADGGAPDVFVSTKHVGRSTRDGLAGLDAALRGARLRGCAVVLAAENRKMRAALAFAQIDCDARGARPMGARHLMLAHHAPSAAAAVPI